MKRYDHLYEKIYDIENLRKAHQHAKKGKGWYKEVIEIDKDPDKYLKQIQDMLINHTYRTSEYEVFTKQEGKKERTIYKLPYFPDRICQWAILQVIEPCIVNNLTTKAMLDFQGPCYFRTGRPAVECVTDTIENYSFEIGKGVQLKDGKDVTIIACGLMVQEALKAQKLLEAEGISARVIDMHTIKPIDRDIILKAAEETGAIVTAEEHNVIGGLGAAVAEVLVQNKSIPTEFVGVQDTFGHSASPAELLKHYGLTPENIAEKAKKAISRK